MPLQNTLLRRIAGIAFILLLTILGWFNRDGLTTLWAVIRDRQATIVYLDGLGLIGPLVLMGLVGLQVLIPTLPAEPPMIASGYVYGFASGFLMNWLVAVAVSQAVFYLARHAGRPVVERLVPAKLLEKWTSMVGEQGTIFLTLAFVIPPIPNDIMIYVAGLTPFSGRRFFVANLIGRAPMVALITLVGANGLSITPAMILGLCVFGVLILLAWWHYLVRERQVTVGSRLDESKAGGGERREHPAPIPMNLLLNPVPSLARRRPLAIEDGQKP